MSHTLQRDEVASRFSRAAPTYNTYASFQRRVADLVLQKVESVLKDGSRFLDIGCGTQYLIRRLQEDNTARCRITGADISFEMLNSLPESRSNGSDKVSLIQADAHYLPFRKDVFDIIVSSLVFQWCDIERALREAWRVLAKNGIMIAALMGAHSYNELRETLKASFRLDDEFLKCRMPKFPDINEILHLTKSLSSGSAFVYKKKYLDFYPTVRAILSELKYTGANINSLRLYEGLGSRKFLAALEEEYKKRYSSANGLCLTREIIVIELAK